MVGASFACTLLLSIGARVASAQTCSMTAPGQKAVYIPGGHGLGCDAAGVKDCCYCVDDMAACEKVYHSSCQAINKARWKQGFDGCTRMGPPSPSPSPTPPPPTPTPSARCDLSENICQMVAPFGEEITDSGQGYPSSSFKTRDGCLLGCRVTSNCQSFSFDDDLEACTWYKPSDASTGDQSPWNFRMGVNLELDLRSDPPVINHGTVHGFTVITPPVITPAVSKVACEEHYAELWASAKSGTDSKIQLGPEDYLIGGYAPASDPDAYPKAGEWFGIGISQSGGGASIPAKFLKGSLTYHKPQGSFSGLQATDSPYSPACDGKSLVANQTDRSTRLVDGKPQFKWTMPPNSPGLFAWVGEDGVETGVLRINDDNALVISMSPLRQPGLATQDYQKMINYSELNEKTSWIWNQPDFHGGRVSGCIKTQSGTTCSVPLDGGTTDDGHCDDGWQFIVEPEGASESSLQRGELDGGGRCIIYKMSGPDERLEQPDFDVPQACSSCANRYGKFACVTSKVGENCHLVPSASYCTDPDRLGGTFCNPLPQATALTQIQCSDEACSQNRKKTSFPLNKCYSTDLRGYQSQKQTGCDATAGIRSYELYERTQCEGSPLQGNETLGDCKYDSDSGVSYISGCHYGVLDTLMNSLNSPSVMMSASRQRKAKVLGEIVI